MGDHINSGSNRQASRLAARHKTTRPSLLLPPPPLPRTFTLGFQRRAAEPQPLEGAAKRLADQRPAASRLADNRNTGRYLHLSFDNKIASLKIAPKEFTVPTQDHHGHSARMGFRVPPGMVAELGAIMQKHGIDFGWSTEADFLRWAMRHGMDVVGKQLQDSRITNLRQSNHIARQIYAEQREFCEMDSLIDEARKMVTGVTNAGGVSTLPMVLKGLRTHLASCNDAFWRERWLAQFDREFGHFFRTASLVDVDESE